MTAVEPGRDPLGKTLTIVVADAYPDWTDQQIADRIKQQCGHVIDADEVAHWRAEADR